jgi:hypothetical protein
MNDNISEIAQEIIKENNLNIGSKSLYLTEVNLREYESYFIDDGYSYHDNNYALFEIKYFKKAESEVNIKKKYYPKLTEKNNIKYMPISAQKRITDSWGNICKGFHHKKSGTFFSNIDIYYDNDVILDIIYELQPLNEFELFFNTPEAQKQIGSWLIRSEFDEWEENLQKRAETKLNIKLKTLPTKENPFLITVYGKNSCWKGTKSTFEECLILLKIFQSESVQQIYNHLYYMK